MKYATLLIFAFLISSCSGTKMANTDFTDKNSPHYDSTYIDTTYTPKLSKSDSLFQSSVLYEYRKPIYIIGGISVVVAVGLFVALIMSIPTAR